MKRCKDDKNLIQKLAAVFLKKGLGGGGIFGFKKGGGKGKKGGEIR
jgi:hypothetical protein